MYVNAFYPFSIIMHNTVVLVLVLFVASSVQSGAPGGFVEKSNLQSVRRDIFDLSTFIPPTRGAFDFPAPYGTRGYRITDESDGNPEANGYSYWSKINFHKGSDIMYILVGFGDNSGVGATIFSLNKTSEEVSRVGAVFPYGIGLAYSSSETMFFSYTVHLSRFYRRDILTNETTMIYDTENLVAGTYPWQGHASADDQVFSFTLKRSTDYAVLGCAVYFAVNDSFVLFDGEQIPSFDECQVDKSGRYLLIKANVDENYSVDGVFINLDTGASAVVLDQNGGPGHSDNGYGAVISVDDWADNACRVYRWDFQAIIDGAVRENMTITFDADGWANTGGCANHFSWTNAKDPAIVPYEHQFICGSNFDDNTNMAKSNEVFCWRPDSTHDVLIVAPSMTFGNASGGGYYYNKLPKAVLDVSGDYILWSTNLRSDRLDIIVARVPWHHLVAPADYNPGEVTPSDNSPISAPVAGTPSVTPSQGPGTLQSGSSSVFGTCAVGLVMAIGFLMQ